MEKSTKNVTQKWGLNKKVYYVTKGDGVFKVVTNGKEVYTSKKEGDFDKFWEKLGKSVKNQTLKRL